MTQGQVSQITGYYLQMVWPDGTKSEAVPALFYTSPPPYIDGRTQMEQNVSFLLRAASLTNSFAYIYDATGYQANQPNNYTFASLYDSSGWTGSGLGVQSQQNWQRPFDDNYRYRNFLYINNTNLDGSGFLNTGAYFDENGMLHLPSTPVFQFSAPTTNTTIPALDSSTWMQPYTDYQPLGIYTNGSGQFALPNNIYNWFGLHLSYVLLAHNHAGTLYLDTLSAGSTWPKANDTYYFYPQFDQPQLQTVGYYFGRMDNEFTWGGPWINQNVPGDPLPGENNFSPTNAQPLLIVGMNGQPVRFAAFAEKIVVNGDQSKPVYVGQYFDKAYKVDTNGVVTSTQTGILSPWGDFFPTEPGPVALVTVPDIDTGQRGTGIVYVVSLQVDANHDGVMDPSYFGQDETYGNPEYGIYGTRPFTFWINNGYIQPGNGAILDQDLQIYPNQANYGGTNIQPNYAYQQITCQRDLENFARLWVSGLPALPASQGYSVTLGFNSYIGANCSLNLYPAYEADGGTGYLTDTNTATAQLSSSYLNGQFVNYGQALAQINGYQSYTLPMNNNGNPLFTHFLFEGANAGDGQLTLTISQNGNVIAEADAYISLDDIKNYYEQAEVTNVAQTWPNMVWQTNSSSFAVLSTPPYSSYETNQLVVFIHGWRMTAWDVEDFSDIMFKRLYWAGYQGRFASLQWPTHSADDMPFGLEYLSYDPSEYIAFNSGSGASAYLDNLASRYPGYDISVAAHSMGNIVMMEALKDQLAEGHTNVDNYVLMQGAVPAECYDTSSALNYSKFMDATTNDPTPDAYHGYPGAINNAIKGSMVNFFNTNDFALAKGTITVPILGTVQVNWEANELDKPFSSQPFLQYYSNGTNAFKSVNGDATNLVTDPHEIMAFVALPRTKAVGAQQSVSGVIHGQIDLHANFGFDLNRQDHSAQFNWNIQNVEPFYSILLNTLFPPQ